jgi:hypothetical protein
MTPDTLSLVERAAEAIMLAHGYQRLNEAGCVKAAQALSDAGLLAKPMEWRKPDTLPHPKDAGLFWAAIRTGPNGGPYEWDMHLIALDDETHEVHDDYYRGWSWAQYELWMPAVVPTRPDAILSRTGEAG